MPFFSLLYIFAQNLDVWVKWKNKFLSKQVWIFDSYYFGGGNGNCSHKFSVHNCILVLLCGIFINDNYLWFNRVVNVLQKQKPREGMVAVCWQNIPNLLLHGYRYLYLWLIQIKVWFCQKKGPSAKIKLYRIGISFSTKHIPICELALHMFDWHFNFLPKKFIN